MNPVALTYRAIGDTFSSDLALWMISPKLVAQRNQSTPKKRSGKLDFAAISIKYDSGYLLVSGSIESATNDRKCGQDQSSTNYCRERQYYDSLAQVEDIIKYEKRSSEFFDILKKRDFGAYGDDLLNEVKAAVKELRPFFRE